VAGLLVLLFGQRPGEIALLTIDDLATSGGQTRYPSWLLPFKPGSRSHHATLTGGGVPLKPWRIPLW
jgi:integrase